MSAFGGKADMRLRGAPSPLLGVNANYCSGSFRANLFAFEGRHGASKSRAKARGLRYHFGAACNVINRSHSLHVRFTPESGQVHCN
jgi:hypothetical protein